MIFSWSFIKRFPFGPFFLVLLALFLFINKSSFVFLFPNLSFEGILNPQQLYFRHTYFILIARRCLKSISISQLLRPNLWPRDKSTVYAWESFCAAGPLFKSFFFNANHDNNARCKWRRNVNEVSRFESFAIALVLTNRTTHPGYETYKDSWTRITHVRAEDRGKTSGKLFLISDGSRTG